MRTPDLGTSSKSQNQTILAVLATAALFCLFVSSCGGGGGSSTAPPPIVVISISPTTASVMVDATKQFTATVSNTSNTGVTWSVNNTAGGNSTLGTVSSAGLYTAPDLVPSSGSVTVTATSQADSTKSASATVALMYPVPSLSSVSPTYALVNSPETTLTLAGSGFTKASTVSFNNNSLSTTFVSGAQLTAVLPAADESAEGQFNLVVANPSPGGGTSSAMQFNVVGGALAVKIIDLPSGTPGNVTVTGPNGLNLVLTSSQTITGAEGTYNVTAKGVTVGSSTYDAKTPTQNVTIAAGNSTSLTVDYYDVVPNTTKVLDQTAMQSLSVSPDGLTLTMSASSPVAQSLEAGDVIVATPTSADGVAPKGMLRQVLSVSSNTSQVVATTQQGTLAEAFQRANFQVQSQLTSNTIQAVRTHPGVTFHPGASFHRVGNGRKSLIPSDTLSDPCGGYSLGVFDVPEAIQVDAVPGLTLSGSVEVCSGLNFSVDIIGTGFLGLVPTLKSLTATASMGAYSDLTLQGDFLSGSFDSQHITLATLDFPPIDVPGLPVWVTPEVSVFVGANGNLSAGITTEVSAAGTYTGGVTYAAGAWSPVPLTPSFQFAYQPPTLNSSLSAKAYAGIEFDLYVYDVVGPSFKPDGYLDLVATITPNPLWTLTAGLEGPMSLDVSFLGENLASYDLGTMFDYSDVLASGAFSTGSSNPVPSITSLSPSSLTVGATAQNLTISGTGFLSTSTVTFNGIAHTPTFVSSTQLTISLTTSDLATAGSFPVVVTNPAPGGGASNAVNVTVGNPLPVIASLSPASLPASATPQNLTITGTGFLSNSTVTFNGIAHTLTFISSTQLTIALTASDLATTGTFAVVVTNPAPGGGFSNTVDFTVQAAGTQTTTEILISDSAGQLWKTQGKSEDAIWIGRLPAVMSDIAAFNGTLYGISGGGSTLYSIDPSSGSGTAIGSGTGAALNALAFSPSGTLYAAGGDSLYTIDITTGTATEIGSGSGAGAYTSSGDLEFDSSGNLYLTSTGASGDQLFAIDPTTGQGTLIGNIGYSQVYGLAYFNGVMYGFTGGGSAITINLTTGAGTLVCTYNLSFDGATAIAPPTPPSPQTLLADAFTTDTSLNASLWSVDTTLLQQIAEYTGYLTNAAYEQPVLAFSDVGMSMSGTNSDYQFTGIQSNTTIAPPFTFQTTVEATVDYGCAFQAYIVSGDRSQSVFFSANLAPASGYYGMNVNTGAIDGGGYTSFDGLYDGTVNTWYLVTFKFDENGYADATLSDASGNRLNWTVPFYVGKGPFYVVLAQYEGGPDVSGPQTAIWQSVSVTTP